MGTTEKVQGGISGLLILFAMLLFPQSVLGDSWWDTDWQFRKEITINHTNVASSLTNFVVLISIVSDSNLAASVQSDGDDIVFTDSDDVRLDHEIELYEGSTGRLIAWVRVPTVSSIEDTIIYMYYGNADCSNQENPENVWDSDYVMVQHLEETSGTHYDSTSYHNDGVPQAGLNQDAVGRIDGSDQFDGGSDRRIELGTDNSLNLIADLAIEAWIYPVGWGESNWGRIVCRRASSPSRGYEFLLDNDGGENRLWFSAMGLPEYDSFSELNSISLNTWQHVVVTRAASDGAVKFYINGAASGTGSMLSIPSAPDVETYIGIRSDMLREFNGIIDEVRISDTVRSADWISTEYNNQNSPDTFYSVGPEQTSGINNPPNVSNPSPSNNATGVSISLSNLSFTLTDSQNDLMNYSVTTSPDIGSGSVNDVNNGTYSISVSGLSYNTTYTWQVDVNDPCGSGNTTTEVYAFTTESEPGGWWDNSWLKRKSVTINHTQVVGDLNDYPVLINITDTDLQADAQPDGDDIVFTDYWGTQLDYEIELYDSDTGHLVMWIRVPSLPSSADTDLFMYYGNASAGNQEAPETVWDSGFEGVWHLNEDSGAVYDSTSNHYDGTPQGGVTQDATGIINGADSFDGLDDATTTTLYPYDGPRTLEYWVNFNSLGVAGQQSIGCHDKNNHRFYAGKTFDNKVWFGAGNTYHSTVSINIDTGTWYYIVLTADGSTAKFYLDAVEKDSFSYSQTGSSSDRFDIGARQYGTDIVDFVDGIVDEVRVSYSARTDDWISTTFNNISNPGTFYIIGTEQTPDMNTPPTVSSPSPADGASDVSLSLSELTFDLNDIDDDAIDYQVTMNPDVIGGIQSGTGIASGTTIHIPIVGSLEYGTLYVWQVEANDPCGSGQTTTATYSFTTQLESPGNFDPFAMGWQYYKQIIIDHTKVGADLTNFPLLIDMTDIDLKSNAQNSGDDILFMDDIGFSQQLNHEIELYDNSSGHLTAWVNIPFLSSTTDTILYMYYGNPYSANQENPVGVWSSEFNSVWHLNHNLLDSTSNDNEGTNYGSSDSSGRIANGRYFDGSDYITTASHYMGADADWTTNFWFRSGSSTSKAYEYLISTGTWEQPGEVHLYLLGTGSPANLGEMTAKMRDTEADEVWPREHGGIDCIDGQWHLTHCIWNAAEHNLSVYVDGIYQVSETNVDVDAGQGTDNLLYMGCRGDFDAQRFHVGDMDEIRISNVAKSPGWITTEYHNQNDTASFYSVGGQQLKGAPLVTSPSPLNGAINVEIDLSELQFTLDDPENDLMDYTVTTVPDIGSDSNSGVSDGNYSVSVSGLSYSTTYNWYVYVTDGINETNRTFSFTTRPENYPPTITNESPGNNAIGIQLNPTLSVDVEDLDGELLDISFETDANGSWQIIEVYTGVSNGTYTAQPTNMDNYDTTYNWRVTVTDGTSVVEQTYSFTTFSLGVQVIGEYFCWGNADIARSAVNPDRYYIVFQHPDGAEHSPWYAEFDRISGWITTDQPVCDWSVETIQNGHPFLMYYDDKIHLAWSYGFDAQHDDPIYSYIDEISADTFDDFHSMVPGNRGTPITEDFDDRFVGNAYSFSNSNCWHFGRNSGQHIEYWKWTPEMGWSIPGTILTQTVGGWGPGLLPMDRNHFYLYYQDRNSDTVRYVESFDGGRTWGAEQIAISDIHDYSSRMNFVRYGDNIYLPLIDNSGNDLILYYSNDGLNWVAVDEIYGEPSRVPNIAMLSQDKLLWTTAKVSPLQQLAGVCMIDEMLANPEAPTDPYPDNGSTVVQSQDTVSLSVTVHGSQTYDVAFYLSDGAFIGEDKLLKQGQTASVDIDVFDGQTIEWYAVVRGTTYDYWGNEPDVTTDEVASDVYSFTVNLIPQHIFLSNPVPEDDHSRVELNPQLSIDVDNDMDNPMNIIFESDATGSWEVIETFTNTGDGTYTATPLNMLVRGSIYHWRVTAVDAADANITTTEIFTLTLAEYAGDRKTQVGIGNCWKIPYIRPTKDKGQFIVIWSATGPKGYAKYDVEDGWIITDEQIFGGGHCSHPHWGYWGDQYHVMSDGYNGIWIVDSDTWEGFRSIHYNESVQIGYNNWQEGLPSAYSFSNNNAWIMCAESPEGCSNPSGCGTYFIKYYEWDSETGWGDDHGTGISATGGPTLRATPALLMFNRDIWYLYYVAGARTGSADVAYIKTTDGGQTWGAEQICPELSTHHQYSRLSLTRYGNNFYIFLIAPNSDAVTYPSTDMETWGSMITVDNAADYVLHHGTMLHQGALISAAGQLDPYTGPVWGFITPVPEMLAYPGEPNDPYPQNGAVIPEGTTDITLSVIVHGDQVYDVAFYWGDGTFIGEDRLLEEGDEASIDVNGLSYGETYQWYAISRGARYDYTASEPMTTSDESWSEIFSFVIIPQEPIVSDEVPPDNSVDVPISLSQLSFYIEDFQSDLMDYTVTTDPDIGSDSNSGVFDGTYFVDVSGLECATTYQWYIDVTDGENWTSKTFNFTTEAEPPAWYNDNWLYRKRIKIKSDKVNCDLSDFPALVDLTDSDLQGKAQEDGDDILFTDSNGLRLSHEIERYEPGSGHLVSWVNVPHLLSSVNTNLYLYYGNSSAGNQEDIESVWDSNYVMVHHLEDIYDSTSYFNDGIAVSNVNLNSAGLINGAGDFSDGYINVGDNDSLKGMDSLTVEAWVNADSELNCIISKWNSWTSGTGGSYNLWQGSSGNVGWGVITETGWSKKDGPVLAYGQWYYLVGVYDGSRLILYINGTQEGAIVLLSGSVASSIDLCYLGRYTYVNMDGKIDEIRLSNVARSECWISTSYNNQAAPGSFYMVGPEESRPISLSGQVQLEGFVGDSREVKFTATGGESTKTWTQTLDFDGGVAFYTLTDVPEGTTYLSSKTDWSLRRKIAVTDVGNYQLEANFTGNCRVLGGDINGTNSVNILDYALLRSNWMTTTDTADINGDKQVQLLDYMIMRSNWFKQGDPE
jgi:hypothetical protein